MKKLTTLFLCAFSSLAMAQIPNASFENWTGNDPTGWISSNFITAGTVTKSTNAYAGNFAVSMNSVTDSVSILETGNESTGYFANSGNPAAINGWYILNSVGNDQIDLLSLTNLSDGTNNGGAGFADSTTTAVYKYFSACFEYDITGTADSATIIFELFNSTGYTHSGSYALIDDLSFGACATGIENITNEVSLEPAYPNPANDICNIIYTLPNAATVNVSLYDISGRKVMNVLNNTRQTSGRYKIPVEVSSLSNGVYIYTITVDGIPYSQKMTVVK